MVLRNSTTQRDVTEQDALAPLPTIQDDADPRELWVELTGLSVGRLLPEQIHCRTSRHRFDTKRAGAGTPNRGLKLASETRTAQNAQLCRRSSFRCLRLSLRLRLPNLAAKRRQRSLICAYFDTTPRMQPIPTCTTLTTTAPADSRSPPITSGPAPTTGHYVSTAPACDRKGRYLNYLPRDPCRDLGGGS